MIYHIKTKRGGKQEKVKFLMMITLWFSNFYDFNNNLIESKTSRKYVPTDDFFNEL